MSLNDDIYPEQTRFFGGDIERTFNNLITECLRTSQLSIDFLHIGLIMQKYEWRSFFNELKKHLFDDKENYHFIAYDKSPFIATISEYARNICIRRIRMFQSDNLRFLVQIIFGLVSSCIFHPYIIKPKPRKTNNRKPNGTNLFVKRQVWLTKTWNVYLALVWESLLHSKTIPIYDYINDLLSRISIPITSGRAASSVPQQDDSKPTTIDEPENKDHERDRYLSYTMAFLCTNIFIITSSKSTTIQRKTTPIWLSPQMKLDISTTSLDAFKYSSMTFFHRASMFRISMHYHSFRATRSFIHPLPLMIMNIEDPQDYAAVVSDDTKIGKVISDLCNRFGTILSMSSYPKTKELKRRIVYEIHELDERLKIAEQILAISQSQLNTFISNDNIPLLIEIKTKKWRRKNKNDFNSVLIKRTEDPSHYLIYDNDAMSMKTIMTEVNLLLSDIQVLRHIVIHLNNEIQSINLPRSIF